MKSLIKFKIDSKVLGREEMKKVSGGRSQDYICTCGDLVEIAPSVDSALRWVHTNCTENYKCTALASMSS